MKAFVELEQLAGNILSHSLVTPRRGRRVVAGVIIEDAIDLAADIVPEGV